MASNPDKIRSMIALIDEMIDRGREMENTYREALEKVDSNFAKSARNMLHYRAMRAKDIRDLQKRLGNLGISRLAKAEAHVMFSLQTTRGVLKGFLDQVPVQVLRSPLSAKKSKQLHKTNAKDLLGYRSHGRRTRIMVTLPTEAAGNYHMVYSLVAKGMNCARINCAHDDAETWKRMIANVRKASEKLRNHVKITMDLGGPKIRTGALEPGPKVKKYRPTKGVKGYIIQPLPIWLGPVPHPDPSYEHLPISATDIGKLKENAQLEFRDARNKKRTIQVKEKGEQGYYGLVDRTTFLETGMPLFGDYQQKGDPIRVGELPAVEKPIVLNIGDCLRLHRNPEPGAPAKVNEKGKVEEIAHISCTLPEVFPDLREGEKVLFDDGKIEGVIREAGAEAITVEITHASAKGGKLRADKGVNFPKSRLNISGLTDKDREDLNFVAEYADVVNFSFVNSARDVRELINEIERLGAKNKLGIILKIETQRGYDNLMEILLEAMRIHPLGVMIARGDLAIETGWDNIGRVQEEILFMCRAAHISDIWATQVLENLAKYGIPSRAEITDAAMAQRADCVMLNKGPYILQAIELLDTILKDLAPYQDKNAPMLPALK